jgi:hypothetical protein
MIHPRECCLEQWKFLADRPHTIPNISSGGTAAEFVHDAACGGRTGFSQTSGGTPTF